MKILTVLTYYRPHTSGLTIYVERLASSLVKLGHEVTVLTSQYDPTLPREEVKDGVRIVRAPALFRVSKGVIMPTFGLLAWRLVLDHEVIHLHLPQFDAAGVAFRGRFLKKPTILTYHCDLKLPEGFFNRVVNFIVLRMNALAGILAHRIGAYTEDFAEHSPFLKRFADKVQVILPPVRIPDPEPGQAAAFQKQVNPREQFPLIGMATRFASEKGVEVLLRALPRVLESYPDARVLFAGEYQDVMGEQAYFERLKVRIEEYQSRDQWEFLGILRPDEMAAFYRSLDVLVVPSLNSTETFGLVQIEAMMEGTPTVASNLPGVRVPPTMTGMGEVIPIGDAQALAEKIINVVTHPERYQGNPQEIREIFDPLRNAEQYQELYLELLKELD